MRMVSDASKKKAASKKAAAAEKRGSKAAAAVAQSKLKDVQTGAAAADAAADEVLALAITDRTCTGVLASHPQSRDIHVRRFLSPESISISQQQNSVVFSSLVRPPRSPDLHQIDWKPVATPREHWFRVLFSRTCGLLRVPTSVAGNALRGTGCLAV